MGQIVAWDRKSNVPARRRRQFETNKHGHIVLTVMNSGRTGPAEVATLDWEGYFIDHRAASIISSPRYEEEHVLGRGVHRIVLMPGSEIRDMKRRTSAQCLKRGVNRYGYKQPTANVMIMVRRILTDADMDELGLVYVVALHEPIEDHSGCESQLQIYRAVGGIVTQPSFPRRMWRPETAFAFLE